MENNRWNEAKEIEKPNIDLTSPKFTYARKSIEKMLFTDKSKLSNSQSMINLTGRTHATDLWSPHRRNGSQPPLKNEQAFMHETDNKILDDDIIVDVDSENTSNFIGHSMLNRTASLDFTGHHSTPHQGYRQSSLPLL